MKAEQYDKYCESLKIRRDRAAHRSTRSARRNFASKRRIVLCGASTIFYVPLYASVSKMSGQKREREREKTAWNGTSSHD